ncbi:DUF1549 domain-containing protein [Blastopirellula marina]|uniref:Cytochrome c domain-containing protein n=1 Tax=Blastopirellula marina TaxID=124 RepID=A0A2S8F9K7_9BACT|nr:DUF1549 domain-containing protein [Blastopirellula marina]PQO28822.1 hypothetical protein C5Y98_23950 [Blastopirellula marina]PTL42095.1 DUF1549 domain-containing protein [Blastopirellula marina]
MRILSLFLALLAFSPAFGAEVDFAHEIVPLLKQKCGNCHSGTQKEGAFSFNTREDLITGGESGAAIVPRKVSEGELIARITTDDEFSRMPPEGEPLSAEQIGLLKRWIESGAQWEPGFTFGEPLYEPPLRPRRPELPAAVAGRTNPIDRILDAQLASQKRPLPEPLGDEAFLRRAYLDLIGILPTPEERVAFLSDSSPDKRTKLVDSLLARDINYAEHWLTFWNDLLRNDYAGTGFITGGRTQISKWLYEALVTNKPYDQFVRELIAPPTPESAGFAGGIKWRGEVSAGQTVEIQFAQNVGQSFLGINLKCASCHDSFIDRWKLKDSFGLAAVYAQRPLEIHRCDKPIGENAQAAWLFPELGQIDANASQPERLKQLANLMTHRENGRFTRTIVNRLWHRMMGYGIVHPTDAMQSPPWNADLLDFLAEDLVDHNYDLKATLKLIATSQAYQSQAQRVTEDSDNAGYQYAGPRTKRMTAEQFVDCVWEITQTAPTKYDAPVIRANPETAASKTLALSGHWIWSRANTGDAAAGETITLRKRWNQEHATDQAYAAISCDNAYTLYVNGKKVQSGDNWLAPDLVLLPHLKKGQNEILIVAKNAGSGPNAAALFFEARIPAPEKGEQTIASDESWQWTSQVPEKNGKFAQAPKDWAQAAIAADEQIWSPRVSGQLTNLLSQGNNAAQRMVRASLLKSDFLMRSLGRPNRDQVVTVRPLELTTLEAIDLSNGEPLAKMLHQGAITLGQREWKSPDEFVTWLYNYALSRNPTAEERNTLSAAIGNNLETNSIEDVLWAVFMLPEFQLVR